MVRTHDDGPIFSVSSREDYTAAEIERLAEKALTNSSLKELAKTVLIEWRTECLRCGHARINHVSDMECDYDSGKCSCHAFKGTPGRTIWERLRGNF